MNSMMPYIFIVGMIISAAIAFFALQIIRRLYFKLKEKEVALAEAAGGAEGIKRQLEELEVLKKEYNQALEVSVRSASEKAETVRQLELVLEERNVAREAMREAEKRAYEAEKQADLVQQKMDDMLLRMQDWEKQREESIQSARAAIFKAGSEMSTKLLEDHKREAESAKKQQEEKIQTTTAKLMEQFTEVTKAVHSLKDISHNNRTQMDVVMRTLSNPGGAGRMAEIGLENSLKNLGLEVGRDFIMQYHIAGETSGLRPDAVVFLPQDMVMVIDSKASKFILELAESSDDMEAEILSKLSKSMNEHLRALSAKDYRSAILQSFKEAGKGDKIGYVFNVMYLPSESVIEKIRRADVEFDRKIERAGIILAGPASLTGLFSLAKMQIAAAKQADNEKHITEVVAELMESVATAFAYADKIGMGLKTTTEHFEKFARSVNSRMLPRMQKLSALGVTPARGKNIPVPLATYDIRRIDGTINVDINNVELEEEGEAVKLRLAAGGS